MRRIAVLLVLVGMFGSVGCGSGVDEEAMLEEALTSPRGLWTNESTGDQVHIEASGDIEFIAANGSTSRGTFEMIEEDLMRVTLAGQQPVDVPFERSGLSLTLTMNGSDLTYDQM